MKHKRNRVQQAQQPTPVGIDYITKAMVAGLIDGVFIFVIYCAVFGSPSFTGQPINMGYLVMIAVAYVMGMKCSPAKRTVGRTMLGIY